MRRAAEALEAAAVVARFGNANAASDVEVALELLAAAARGAQANVAINLASVDDTVHAERLRAEVARLAQECEAAAAAARHAASQQG